jgi:hypothetical protein
MIMDRIVELGVGVVEDDEEVILVDGDDFLLEFTHGAVVCTKVARIRKREPAFQKSTLF